jgi:hypothetical protein
MRLAKKGRRGEGGGEKGRRGDGETGRRGDGEKREGACCGVMWCDVMLCDVM